jgi:hypothetical protein
MKNDKLKDIYGPGNDDYGRNKSPLMETEKCVSCGIDTKVPVYMHIDYRSYYVEGAGQLCEKCYDEIYNFPKT